MTSHREPKLQNVRNGFAVTKEYRADGKSNCAVRSKTMPAAPNRFSTSDSGVCAVGMICSSGRIYLFAFVEIVTSSEIGA